jgi:hypothetical protein
MLLKTNVVKMSALMVSNDIDETKRVILFSRDVIENK